MIRTCKERCRWTICSGNEGLNNRRVPRLGNMLLQRMDSTSSPTRKVPTDGDKVITDKQAHRWVPRNHGSIPSLAAKERK